MTTDIRNVPPAPSRAALKIGLCVFLGIVAFFLWTEHRAHLFGALPYLLLLLCPVMHRFMHHGHGAHGGDSATHDHGANQ